MAAAGSGDRFNDFLFPHINRICEHKKLDDCIRPGLHAFDCVHRGDFRCLDGKHRSVSRRRGLVSRCRQRKNSKWNRNWRIDYRGRRRSWRSTWAAQWNHLRVRSSAILCRDVG